MKNNGIKFKFLYCNIFNKTFNYLKQVAPPFLFQIKDHTELKREPKTNFETSSKMFKENISPSENFMDAKKRKRSPRKINSPRKLEPLVFNDISASFLNNLTEENFEFDLSEDEFDGSLIEKKPKLLTQQNLGTFI